MNACDVQNLRQWFNDFTGNFYSEVEEDQRNILLKVDHSHRVCTNILVIAESTRLDQNSRYIAETIALVHDIGRFPQYARYKTFRDADSMNHGLLGARTLEKEHVLEKLPRKERDSILTAVKFHNAFAIPNTLDREKTFFLKLIRDADKLDIFRVFLEYYDQPREKRASATAFGVPDTPECSESMLARLLNRQVAAYSDIESENDFKLMKLSWIYDMHFAGSLKLIRDLGYIDRIAEKLPQADRIAEAVDALHAYVICRLEEDGQEEY